MNFSVRRAYWLNIAAWALALLAGAGWRVGLYSHGTAKSAALPLVIVATALLVAAAVVDG